MIKKTRKFILNTKAIHYFKLSKKALSDGDSSKSNELLEKSFLLSPNNCEILYHKAKMHYFRKEFSSSISLFEKCIERASMAEGKNITLYDAYYVKINSYQYILACGKKHNIGNYYTEMYRQRIKDLSMHKGSVSPTIGFKFPKFKNDS